MRIYLTFGLLLTTAAVAQAARGPDAQGSPADPRWTPWLGCWSPQEDADAGTPPSQRRAPDEGRDVRVCVRADPDGDGVVVDTTVGARIVLTQTIVASATRRALAEPECEGWQQDEWSASGRGLYSRAELTCGREPRRTVAGLAWNTGDAWLDIQMIDTAGRRNLRIRRYARVEDPGVAAAPRGGSRPLGTSRPALTIDEVRDASGRLPSALVEAALIETGSRFRLNGREMLALDRAGVPDRVLDLMVALSYPKHFVVERQVPVKAPSSIATLGGGQWPIYGGGFGWFDTFSLTDPYLWSAYHSPFGYGYWGLYDPYFYPSAGFVAIGTPGAGAIGEPVEHGRVIADAGYTRVRTREAGTVAAYFGSGRGDGSSGTRSGDGGGSASPTGYSGGGAADGGRTAQPRNPQ